MNYPDDFRVADHVTGQESNPVQLLQPPSTGQSLVLHASVSVASPAHWLPPWAGVGLLHVRVLCWVPEPQDLLQASGGPQSLQPPSTGQSLVLQAWFSEVAPAHSLPPWAGLGLLHVRVLCCVPVPQDLLQAFGGPQSLQPPSTGQSLVLHASLSVASPAHWLPPLAGVGLLHVVSLTELLTFSAHMQD